MEAPPKKKPKISETFIQGQQKPATWRIYPPPGGVPRAFGVGEVVFFRPKSAKEDGRRGVVVETIPKDKDHVWVEFGVGNNTAANKEKNDGRQRKYVSCKRLVPVFTTTTSSDEEFKSQQHKKQPASASPPQQQQQQQQQNQPQNFLSIIFTPETIPYRILACSQISNTDDVLEIGCSTGEASVILYRYGRSWVGFDSSNEMIETCSSRMESWCSTAPKNNPRGDKILWHACKIDALSDPKRAMEVAQKFSANNNEKGPTAAFLDIGGNREEKGVLDLMSWVLKSFSGLKVIVVKSREVVKSLTAQQQRGTGASSTTYTIDQTDGNIQNGSVWFREKLEELCSSNLPRHPLQAPLVNSPTDASQPICRYHNYDIQGCKRGSRCHYDHEHCHLCLQKGHRAIDCSTALAGTTREIQK